MPQQIFLAPLVATTDVNGITSWAPKLNPQVVNYTAVCQQRTVPNPQCLVLAIGDLTSANADSSLVALIADNLDTPTANVSSNVRNRINNGLTNKGIQLTRTIADPNDPNGSLIVVNVSFTDFATVRDFLTALGKWFDPTFTLEQFLVSGR